MAKLDHINDAFSMYYVQRLVLRLHEMSEDERGKWWDETSEFSKAVEIIVAECHRDEERSSFKSTVKEGDVRTVLYLVFKMLDAKDEQADDAEMQKAIEVLDELQAFNAV